MVQVDLRGWLFKECYACQLLFGFWSLGQLQVELRGWSWEWRQSLSKAAEAACCHGASVSRRPFYYDYGCDYDYDYDYDFVCQDRDLIPPFLFLFWGQQGLLSRHLIQGVVLLSTIQCFGDICKNSQLREIIKGQ